MTEIRQLPRWPAAAQLLRYPADMPDFLKVIAGGDTPVLITGDCGAGKELIANLIHLSSERHGRPFVAVSCAILADTLDRPGGLELAEGGTLFLDDIDDLPLTMQVKLLRVLQTRSVERAGSVWPIRIDVRVLAGSKCDLRTLVTAGTFREDLYYRLNVIQINLPPLGERAEEGDAVADSLDERLRAVESQLITAALRTAHGNKSKAAALLRIKRSTLGDRIRKLGLAEVEARRPGLAHHQ